MSARRLSKGAATLRVVATIVAAVAGGFGLVALQRDAGPADAPTAEVRRGPFVEHLQLRGEINPAKSYMLTAPSRAGDLQILKIAESGAVLKAGDPVVQFDPSTLQATLDERRSALRQADAEIDKARAQARLVEEQDRTDLVKARYEVERAKLDVAARDVLPRIDGEKADLALRDAEQKVHEAAEKLKANQQAGAASIEIQRQKRDKALNDVRQTERAIESLTLRTPTSGMVTLMPNWRAESSPGQAPEFKEGDRAWAGAGIAQTPDLTSVRLTARIDEADRGRVRTEQPVEVRVDALPDKTLSGTVGAVSVLARADYSAWPPQKHFELTVSIADADPRLRPGMNATARIVVGRLASALIVPARAVYTSNGRTIVYVQRGLRFEPQVVEIAARGPDEAALANGVAAGDRVALRDLASDAGSRDGSSAPNTRGSSVAGQAARP